MLKAITIFLGSISLFSLSLSVLANEPLPDEVRVAYGGSSQVLVLAKVDGSLEKALNTRVKWVQFATGADALGYFASDAIDIANIGSSPAVAGLVRKLPIEIFGISGVIATSERLIAKDLISSIQDIEGKRVAYPPNSTAQYALDAAIVANHIDRNKVKLIPLRPAEMVAAWKRGDIDAGYVWAPFAQELEVSGGHPVFATKQLQQDGYLIYNNYVVRTAFAKAHPELLSRFLQIHQQKVDQFRRDPITAAAIVAKDVGAPVATAANTLSGLEYPTLKQQESAQWLGNGSDTDNSGIGQAIHKTAGFLESIGEVRKRDIPVTFEHGINVSYLKQAIAAQAQ